MGHEHRVRHHRSTPRCGPEVEEGVERRKGGGQLRRRIRVGDGAADRPAVPDLRMRDEANRLVEQRHTLQDLR